MEHREFESILQKQQIYFATGDTLPGHRRKAALKKLQKALEDYEQQLIEALQGDLGKSGQEAYMCEIGLVKSEISYMLRHLTGYVREHRVHTPLAQSFSRSFVKPAPYGCVLIMSPWNYPVLLALDPLVDALAAGNTAVIKPSAYAPQTAELLAEMIGEIFSQEYVTVIKGGREENQALLDCDFDYIFFTGSKAVGKEVMAKAAERLTPVTLELGGKSPCIVDETADIKVAARRIVFGKFINCGQTCVAPDYIYCAKGIKGRLIEEIKRQIRVQYGRNPLENPDYGRIVNEKHFQRIAGLIDRERVVWGGQIDEMKLKIEPTVMEDVTWWDPVMQEEIFGPVLPILTYESFEEVIKRVNSMDSPLALYLFSSDKKHIRMAKERIQFGGGCINDTLIHLATSSMGFGGVGASGMGAYHGRKGFDTFSHEKSIVDKKTFLDLPMRYQPYTKKNGRLTRLFLR